MEGSKPNLPKLKAFKTIQKRFAVLGINPKLVTQSYPLNGKIFIGFLLLISDITFIFVNIFYYASDMTIFEYTQSIYMGTTIVFDIVGFVILILKVEELFEFINHCDNIINMTLKYSATRNHYYEVNQFEEKLSRIILFAILLNPVCVIVLWTIYIYFRYFTTDLEADAFELPQPMWFPFDWRNPFGFLTAITIQFTMFLHILTIGGCIFVLATASYFYSIALSKVIKESVFLFNRSSQAKTDQSILLEQLLEFLELHSGARQVVTRISDLFQPFITILFVCNLITICGTLLSIQMQLTHRGDNFTELLTIVFQIIYSFGAVFTACELGQRLNLTFDDCNDMIDQFEWYLFPVEIQRMLPLVLNFTQQPFEIICFGSKACDRDTFKSVMKTSYSYFTVLRTFYI